MQFTVRLVGEKPMLMHNGRLANPIDPYTKQVAAISKKRNKTEGDLVDLMRIEARGGCWETDDHRLGVPNEAVWASFFNAAKAYKRGEDLKRGLIFDNVTVPLKINGKTVKCDDYINDQKAPSTAITAGAIFGNILYRPVVIRRNRTMRARPIIFNWESQHDFELLDDVMDLSDLGPILERAGRLVGIGDWRPIYGTYVATIVAQK